MILLSNSFPFTGTTSKFYVHCLRKRNYHVAFHYNKSCVVSHVVVIPGFMYNNNSTRQQNKKNNQSRCIMNDSFNEVKRNISEFISFNKNNSTISFNNHFINNKKSCGYSSYGGVDFTTSTNQNFCFSTTTIRELTKETTSPSSSTTAFISNDQKLLLMLQKIESISRSSSQGTQQQQNKPPFQQDDDDATEKSQAAESLLLAKFWEEEVHDVLLPMLHNINKNFNTLDSLEYLWLIVIDHIIPEYLQFHHDPLKSDPLSRSTKSRSSSSTCPIHHTNTVRFLLMKTLEVRVHLYKRKEKGAVIPQRLRDNPNSNIVYIYNNPKIWQLLQSWDDLPDYRSFNLFLATFLSTDDYDFFNIDYHTPPATTSTTTQQKPQLPNDVIEYMMKSKYTHQYPDLVSFTAALSIWKGRSIHFDEKQKREKGEQTKESTLLSVHDTSTTQSTSGSSCTKEEKDAVTTKMILQNALGIWESMIVSGYHPTVRTVNELLHVYLNCQSNEMVQNVFRYYTTICSTDFRCVKVLLRSYTTAKTNADPNKYVHGIVQNYVVSYRKKLENSVQTNTILSRREIPLESFWSQVFYFYRQYYYVENYKKEYEQVVEQYHHIKELEKKVRLSKRILF